MESRRLYYLIFFPLSVVVRTHHVDQPRTRENHLLLYVPKPYSFQRLMTNSFQLFLSHDNVVADLAVPSQFFQEPSLESLVEDLS